MIPRFECGYFVLGQLKYGSERGIVDAFLAVLTDGRVYTLTQTPCRSYHCHWYAPGLGDFFHSIDNGLVDLVLAVV